ncbi:hypothetical protein M1N86_01560, partial [Dehalococcoidia bacterium]|nr:hypothetical protein [Dehalococcoidia bacterium]
ALSSRIAAELGARVVKTYWCQDFDKVTNGCPVPVVMAGGPKVDTEREVFDFVHDGMQKGAIGVNLGRNIWQHENPVAMIRALRAIIHDGAGVDEAQDDRFSVCRIDRRTQYSPGDEDGIAVGQEGRDGFAGFLQLSGGPLKVSVVYRQKQTMTIGLDELSQTVLHSPIHVIPSL